MEDSLIDMKSKISSSISFKQAAIFHSTLLHRKLHKQEWSREDKDHILLAYYFFQHMASFPDEKYIPWPQTDDCPIPNLFNEIFMQNPRNKDSLIYINVARKAEFYKYIVRGDVVTLKVINEKNASKIVTSDKYVLQIVGKDSLHRKIDDLMMLAYMYKSSEVPEYKENDYIRAVVSDYIADEFVLVVTLDPKLIKKDAKATKLGKIAEKGIPQHKINPKQYKSVSDYLNADPKFNSWTVSGWEKTIEENGLDINHIYSFSERDGQLLTNAGVKQLKEVIEKDVRNYNINAIDYSKSKDYTSAIRCLTLALDLKPNSVELLESRAEMYLKLQKNCPNKSIFDWERAFQIDPTSYMSRKRISDLLYRSARRYYRRDKKYEKALRRAEQSKALNPENADAIKFCNKLKKELPVLLSGTQGNTVPKKEKAAVKSEN